MKFSGLGVVTLPVKLLPTMLVWVIVYVLAILLSIQLLAFNAPGKAGQDGPYHTCGRPG